MARVDAAARLRVMTSASGFAPRLPVRDMESALAYYERLSFQVMPQGDANCGGHGRSKKGLFGGTDV